MGRHLQGNGAGQHQREAVRLQGLRIVERLIGCAGRAVAQQLLAVPRLQQEDHLDMPRLPLSLSSASSN